MPGASPCTSVKVCRPRSATASQVRSKSDMSWPDSVFMAAVGVAACRIAAAALRTVSSRSWAAAGQLAHLFDPGSGDVADALAHRIDGAGQVGQLDHELVDGHARLALEHLEPDDVALDGADLGRHRSEDARGVGQPDPHAGQHGGLSCQFVLVMCTPTCMVCSALPA